MSGSVNAVFLVGRIGKEVEMRYSQSGDPIANFSLATSERWTKNGEKHEETQWHQVVVFGKPAQFCRDYLGKGALVSVEGGIRYEKYKDREGNDRTSTKIRAQRVELLSGKSDRSDRTQPTQEEPQAEFQVSDDDVPF